MSYLSHFEPLAGIVNGVNRDFTASTAFVTGSEVVFVRGLPRRKDWEDGWVVTDASLGQIKLNEAPLADDDVQMLWLEDIPTLPETEVTPLTCFISDVETLMGTIEAAELTGCLVESEEVSVSVIDSMALSGHLVESEEITGQIEGCL
jgi:hypothetical protein